MKLSKKFITAIAMLTLSAVMLTTSSFAWFSMNTEVTATDMTVTAKADQVFLQISNGAKVYDANGDAGSTDMFSDKVSMETAEASEKTGSLYPTAVVEKFDSANGTVDAFTTGSQAKGTVAWVKNYSKDVETSTAAGKYSAIGTASDYYLLNTFYLRLNPSAGNETALAPLNSSVSLDIQKASESDADDAIAKSISVLVVCGDYAQLWKQGASNWVNSGDATLTNGDFTSASGPVEVKVYVFFDGENDNCTTANFSAIKATGYKVAVNFNVTPPSV